VKLRWGRPFTVHVDPLPSAGRAAGAPASDRREAGAPASDRRSPGRLLGHRADNDGDWGYLWLAPELRPPWLDDEGVWLWASLSPERVEGETLAAFISRGRPPRPAIVRGESRVAFLFDWARAFEHLLLERYLPVRRPLHSRLPFHSHVVPAAVRVTAARAKTAVERLRRPRYPRWPIEPSLETLRHVLYRAANMAGVEVAWPPRLHGRGPLLVLTHDVDSGRGLRLSLEVAAVEEGLGLRSTWFVVPRRIQLEGNALERLRSHGHEIGCHGFDHSYRTPFLDADRMRRRLDLGRAALEAFSPKGYRSPGLLRTPALYEELGRLFAYDSSVPDTELYTGAGAGNGCASTMPFQRGGLWVLPATLPLDALLLHYGFGADETFSLWERKLDWIAAVGGVAVATTHPEPQYLGRKEMMRGYERFLARALERGATALTAWEALQRWRVAVEGGASDG